MERSKTLETGKPGRGPRWPLWAAAVLTMLLISAGAFYLLPDNPAALPLSPGQTATPPAVISVQTRTSTSTPTSLPSPTSTPEPTKTQTPSPEPPTSTPSGPEIIGTSTAGRPIQVHRFGSGPSARLIIAGIHGGYEWNTIHLADKMIDHLREHPELIPEEITLYILPNFNPDGYARARGIHGRANENGVDLNRNFPVLWQKNWPLAGCWSYSAISGGDQPASEPETRALMEFVQEHPLDALISYHSAALGIFPGGQPPDPSSVDLAETIAHVSSYPYPPYDLGCKFTGQLIDWSASLGIPSVDIELTNHQDLDWNQNIEILEVFLSWKP